MKKVLWLRYQDGGKSLVSGRIGLSVLVQICCCFLRGRLWQWRNWRAGDLPFVISSLFWKGSELWILLSNKHLIKIHFNSTPPPTKRICNA